MKRYTRSVCAGVLSILLLVTVNAYSGNSRRSNNQNKRKPATVKVVKKAAPRTVERISGKGSSREVSKAVITPAVRTSSAVYLNRTVTTLRVWVRPPAPLREVIPPRPAPFAVWISGYWMYNPVLDEFVWIPGYWDLCPVGTTWIPGYWKYRDGVFVWISGYWVL